MADSRFECERKFLVREIPSRLSKHPQQRIRQGYLAVGGPGPDTQSVRMRRVRERAVLAIKNGQGATRREVEVRLSKAATGALWPLAKGRRLSKTRYEVPCGDVNIDLDVYRARLRGLVTAAVECRSTRAMRRFKPPAWFGREVTGRREYSNSMLALSGTWPEAPKIRGGRRASLTGSRRKARS